MTPKRFWVAAASALTVLSAIDCAWAASTSGVLLSNLPPHESESYATLKALSGATGGQDLEMTKSEMWDVPADHLQALKDAATKAGVEIKVLDASWNTILEPMSGAMSTDQHTMANMATSSKAAMGMSAINLPSANAMEYALTKGMTANGEAGAPSTLVLPLKDGMTVTAQRTSIFKNKDNYAWHGSVEGTGEPVTLIWWPGGRLAGSVTYQGHVYSVRNLSGGAHALVEMAPNMLPADHAPADHGMMEKMHMTTDPLVTKGDAGMLRERPGDPKRGDTKALEDAAAPRQALAFNVPEPPKPEKSAPEVVIRVVVAYTKQAASHYDDIETDLVEVAIEDANQAFRNSGIGNIRIELAKTYKTDYVESGSHFDHVFRFADKGDGYMEEIHAIRDEVKADVGLLIVHDPMGCGLAAGVAPEQDRAFAVVHHECAATSYSMAHEIGHIIGARHNTALDDTMEPYPYGHGFVNGTKWRTMMSYMESCGGCPRLPVWSNPEIMIQGVAAGDDKSNNARVLLEGAARVAGFR